jgi:hypothetical protein
MKRKKSRIGTITRSKDIRDYSKNIFPCIRWNYSQQTLNIEGCIKNEKVTILIDSGSTHNFINYK